MEKRKADARLYVNISSLLKIKLFKKAKELRVSVAEVIRRALEVYFK